MNGCRDCEASTVGTCSKHFQSTLPLPQTQPFRCPVCGGNGIVSAGFYNTTTGSVTISATNPETCRSCFGTGIVWR